MNINGTYRPHRVRMIRSAQARRGDISKASRRYLSPEERLNEILRSRSVGNEERATLLENEAAAKNDDDYWTLAIMVLDQYGIESPKCGCGERATRTSERKKVVCDLYPQCSSMGWECDRCGHINEPGSDSCSGQKCVDFAKWVKSQLENDD